MTATDTRLAAGRRLTEDEAQTGAEMFAADASEREVADRLQCSPSTAHRLRLRLDAADTGEQDQPGTGVTDEPAGAGQTLTALRDKRDQWAAQHGALLDRIQAAREAVEDIDARRMDALAGGGDSTRFAAERAPLELEHARLAADAGVVGGWLADCEAEIASREAGQAERARLAEQAKAAREAQAEGDGLAPVAAGKLRATVLGEVGAAELVRVARRLVELEAVAGKSWDNGILPPPLLMNHDAWHQRVAALWSAARAGQLADVHGALAGLGGQWQERDREQLARERQAADDQLRQAREEADANMRRGRLHGGPMFLPEQPGFGAAMPPVHMFLDRAPVQGG